MAEEVPVSEVRRVVIQYEIKLPRAGAAAASTPAASSSQAAPELDIEELADKVRRELQKTGVRNVTTGLV